MSAVQESTKRRRRRIIRVVGWPRHWELFALPVPVIGYILSVQIGYAGLAGWEFTRTSARAWDIMLFAALMACGAVCVEATRRLGQPAGVSRDLLSAWWLPVALLLPPLYALIAPALLGLLLYLRVRRGPLYRRVFSSAALGLAGAAASILFRWLAPAAPQARALSWLAYPGPQEWFVRPQQAGIAVCCAVVFGVLNTCLVAVAAWLAEPDGKLSDMLWDRERMLLDLTETCVGVLVTIACALSPLLLCVALPPVIMLQRSLMHQQLKAAARTDPKTGLLNASTWQREADAEIVRALRTGEPVALLLADVDHFKKVNDTYGHLVGDDVLRGLALELRQQVRETDIVGRFGGEEFVILLSRTRVEEALRIAERLRRGVSVIGVLAGDATVGVTISVGVAELGVHGRDLFELLAAADLALYRAKNTGRDRVCLCRPADNPAKTAPRGTRH
ncbi:MAG: GGDEF domain-containing protein [Streptosporangiales bacterium]|jgi:diguanylate cyclase (GGDEF)-like protein|nr:GGDEF domain-containing protein [Streptosporangiales bacterium]